MNENEILLGTGHNISLVAPSVQYMNEFIKQANASQKLHANWTQPPLNKEDFLSYLDRINKDNQCGVFIKSRKTNELIGVINLNEIVRGAFESAYLGYYIFSEFEKQGFMSEALNLLIDYAFDCLQLHRLEANIQPNNINSLRLVEQCGFVREGYSKKYLRIEGQWQDHVRYAITKDMLHSSKISSHLTISPLLEEDITPLVQQFSQGGVHKTASLFNKYLDDHMKGERLVWLAKIKNQYVGYITLVWNSLYPPFFEKKIPEINDLNVLEQFQKQGVGAQLLLTAEKAALTRSLTIGIGFGLYKDYGKAQRLYFSLGYRPDGNGITYHYKPVAPGSRVVVDDDLCLWLTKNISRGTA